MFGVLIAVHELGHFMAAKACGVRVNEFAIGMGPALGKKQKGETLYSLRAFPVGGFCAMEGEEEESDDPAALSNQGFWQKRIIFAAGAAMNFLAGLVIIFCLPFEAMWSYFAWMNQTLAMVTLWMITAYLNIRGRNRWVGPLPALAMTYVCMSYVFISPLMCGMRDRAAAYLLGGALTLAILITMIFKMRRDAKSIS